MSKLTLDEAIKHCEEVAACNEIAGLESEARRQCCNDHRQLAEWLRELKELNEKYREVVMEGEKLNADYTELVALNEQYKNREEQYKQLLKSAISEWPLVCEWGDCGEHCSWYVNGRCSQEWSNKAEALKLIGDENDAQ